SPRTHARARPGQDRARADAVDPRGAVDQVLALADPPRSRRVHRPQAAVLRMRARHVVPAGRRHVVRVSRLAVMSRAIFGRRVAGAVLALVASAWPAGARAESVFGPREPLYDESAAFDEGPMPYRLNPPRPPP